MRGGDSEADTHTNALHNAHDQKHESVLVANKRDSSKRNSKRDSNRKILADALPNRGRRVSSVFSPRAIAMSTDQNDLLSQYDEHHDNGEIEVNVPATIAERINNTRSTQGGLRGGGGEEDVATTTLRFKTEHVAYL